MRYLKRFNNLRGLDRLPDHRLRRPDAQVREQVYWGPLLGKDCHLYNLDTQAVPLDSVRNCLVPEVVPVLGFDCIVIAVEAGTAIAAVLRAHIHVEDFVGIDLGSVGTVVVLDLLYKDCPEAPESDFDSLAEVIDMPAGLAVGGARLLRAFVQQGRLQ